MKHHCTSSSSTEHTKGSWEGAPGVPDSRGTGSPRNHGGSGRARSPVPSGLARHCTPPVPAYCADPAIPARLVACEPAFGGRSVSAAAVASGQRTRPRHAGQQWLRARHGRGQVDRAIEACVGWLALASGFLISIGTSWSGCSRRQIPQIQVIKWWQSVAVVSADGCIIVTRPHRRPMSDMLHGTLAMISVCQSICRSAFSILPSPESRSCV